MRDIKFDFNDILIQPTKTSTINSRSEVNILTENGTLPLFTAPMDTVVSSDNYIKFLENNIEVVLPRGERAGNYYSFRSFSIGTIEKKMSHLNPKGSYLIDVANGHMDQLVRITKEIKNKYPEITLMVGNIANPQTYEILSEAGADYIRCGIGFGGGCLTSQQTGIGYPMASLIRDCYAVSATLNNPAKIVADGGMKNYSDIIKALALGADYVMLGSVLNKTIESCGDNYLFGKIKVSQKFAEWAFKHKLPIYKKFRGMSTKEVQKKWGRKKLKTSEGVVRMRKVEYTVEQWTENFNDYLKSSMSYSGARTLSEFIGYAKYNFISENSLKRFRK